MAVAEALVLGFLEALTLAGGSEALGAVATNWAGAAFTLGVGIAGGSDT
jgi:hypothetical protein